MPRRAVAWEVVTMKTKPSLTHFTRLSLLRVLVCSTPMLTLAGERREMQERGEKFASHERP